MTSSRFQEPPLEAGASAKTVTVPPAASTFLSFASAKNPTERLLGDQNGNMAPSVPEIGCAAVESRDRAHNMNLPSDVVAAKARRLPSGDRTAGPASSPRHRKLALAGAR